MVATRGHLEDYLGREIITAEWRRADLLLELAEEAVAGHLGTSIAELRKDPPPPCRGVILSVAARCFTNPINLKSMTLGALAEAYGDAGALELTADEARRLSRYRVSAVVAPDAASVPIAPPRHRWSSWPWRGYGDGYLDGVESNRSW